MPIDTPKPGGEGSLRFHHRLESCKLTLPPPWSPFWLSSSQPLHFGCNVSAKNLPSLTPLAFGSEYILFKMTLLSMGLLLRPDSASSVGLSPGGTQSGEERPFSHDLQACDHLICRHECWAAHMKSQGGARKRAADALPARLQLLMRGWKPRG